MVNIIKNEKINNILYKILIFSFCVYIFCKKIWESQLIFFAYDVVNMLTLIAYVILSIGIIYNLFKKVYSIKEIIVYILLSVILFAIYKNTKFNEPLIMFGYMLAFKNVNKELFIKSVFITLLVSFILIVLLALLNIIPNHPEMQVRYGVERARWFLGYNWNNMAMNHYLSIILMYLMYKKGLKLYDYIIILLIDIILFIFTDSKCAFIMIITVLLLYIVFYKRDVLYKKIGKIFIVFPPLAAIIVFLLTYYYDKNNKILSIIDTMITGRLRLANDGYKIFGITLFGHMTNMNIEDGTYNFVDISYLNILFNYGMVLLCLVLVVYVIYTYIAYKNNVKILWMVIIISLLHSMIEPHLISVSNWPFMVLFVNMLCLYIKNVRDGVYEQK